MTSDQRVEELFDQFVTAYGRGDNPDVRDFLQSAGQHRDELGLLIDNFLAFAPIAPTDEETIVLVSARIAGRHPLQEARARRSLTLGTVVEDLAKRLSIDRNLFSRLVDAYEDLERDWLDPRGVDSSVWESLRSIFDLDVRRLVASGEGASAVLMRSEAKLSPRTGVMNREAHSEPPDEIDRLFRGVEHH